MSKGWLALAAMAGAACGTIGLPLLALAAGDPPTGQTSASTASSAMPSGEPAVPPGWVTLEEAAAATCPGLPWSVLGAVGYVESDSGRSDSPGVVSGANSAGAEGPFQFEPATFAAYAVTGPGGAAPPSPYDPTDAAFTAARMLCADGAGSPSTLRAAVLDYDHSTTYAGTVLALGIALSDEPALPASGAAAIAYAAEQLGVPYAWGGTGPGGFDCSGLVQAAYRSAGVSLPRVAQDQFEAGPPVPTDSPLEPGDLVFFGTGPAGVSHVGLVLSPGIMIDAPHTGTVVQAETFPPDVGAPWGGDVVVGATRPDD